MFALPPDVPKELEVGIVGRINQGSICGRLIELDVVFRLIR